jgi:hypothetical protein
VGLMEGFFGHGVAACLSGRWAKLQTGGKFLERRGLDRGAVKPMEE